LGFGFGGSMTMSGSMQFFQNTMDASSNIGTGMEPGVSYGVDIALRGGNRGANRYLQAPISFRLRGLFFCPKSTI
jgi:hypothetical protein